MKNTKCKAAVCLLLLSVALVSLASADETMFILCNPKSEVNVRSGASTKYDTEGRMTLGESVTTDGTEKDHTGRMWAHCIDLGFEANEGWVCAAYLVPDPVDVTEYDGVICAGGRVAAYQSIGGEREWISDGSPIHVFATSGKWSVTNKGYVQCQYIKKPVEPLSLTVEPDGI